MLVCPVQNLSMIQWIMGKCGVDHAGEVDPDRKSSFCMQFCCKNVGPAVNPAEKKVDPAVDPAGNPVINKVNHAVDPAGKSGSCSRSTLRVTALDSMIAVL